MEYLPGPLIASTSNQAILYANQAACDLLEYETPDELVGEHLTVLVPPRYRDAHNAGFGRYRRTGQSRLLGKNLRVEAVKKDGEEVAIELSIRMFRRPDGSDLIIGMLAPTGTHENVIDITAATLKTKLEKRAYKLI